MFIFNSFDHPGSHSHNFCGFDNTLLLQQRWRLFVDLPVAHSCQNIACLGFVVEHFSCSSFGYTCSGSTRMCCTPCCFSFGHILVATVLVGCNTEAALEGSIAAEGSRAAVAYRVAAAGRQLLKHLGHMSWRHRRLHISMIA